MKRNLLIYLLVALACPFVSASAQMDKLEQLSFRNSRAFILDGAYTVTSDFVLDDLHIGTNQLLILTPELRNNKGDESQLLAPIFISGGTRAKVMDREAWLHNERSYMALNPLSVTVRKGHRSQSVSYTYTLPIQPWMRHASLYLKGQLIGCAECDKGEAERVIAERLFFTPKYQASYIVPEVEPVKNREDQYIATVAYRVDKSNIDPDYMNNPAVLADVNDKVAKILQNKDLTVSDIFVKGYASPEATVPYNKALSNRRANGFAEYLISRHALQRSQLKVEGVGEDWEETIRLIEADETVLTPSEKRDVLEVIRTTSGADERDLPLKAINGGATYRKLLREIYPKVRRTVYGFSYVARPFDVEEAKVILRTNPKLLSLNEIYLVANTYEADSKEFKEVFDIAAVLFPDQPVALINASATDLENGRVSRATEKLVKLKEDKRAWNNLAISYALQGNTKEAEALFQKAVQAGDPLAEANLNELRSLIQFRNRNNK